MAVARPGRGRVTGSAWPWRGEVESLARQGRGVMRQESPACRDGGAARQSRWRAMAVARPGGVTSTLWLWHCEEKLLSVAMAWRGGVAGTPRSWRCEAGVAGMPVLWRDKLELLARRCHGGKNWICWHAVAVARGVEVAVSPGSCKARRSSQLPAHRGHGAARRSFWHAKVVAL